MTPVLGRKQKKKLLAKDSSGSVIPQASSTTNSNTQSSPKASPAVTPNINSSAASLPTPATTPITNAAPSYSDSDSLQKQLSELKAANQHLQNQSKSLEVESKRLQEIQRLDSVKKSELEEKLSALESVEKNLTYTNRLLYLELSQARDQLKHLGISKNTSELTANSTYAQ